MGAPHRRGGGAVIDWAQLEAAAAAVRHKAHAPYSNYKVGAALQVASGAMFVGCNVENASYGLSICAERNAVTQMVASGARDPIAIVVITQGAVLGAPCGACRQFLAEFAGDLEVRLISAGSDLVRTTSLGALLPEAFRADALHP